MDNPVSPTVSVVICTYNRCDLLGGAIESVCTQPLDPAAYEVIVADNASTDATRAVVEAAQARFPQCNVRYLLETAPGASHARNAALAQVRAGYVAFLDDDARCAPDYLPRLLAVTSGDNAAQAGRPGLLDCLGGPILPFYTTAKPAWFRDAYEERWWGGQARWLRPGEPFSASNMVWRTAVLRALGGFPTNVGPVGKQLLMGEESVIFLRYAEQVPPERQRVLYLPWLLVYHWSPPRNMAVGYRLKRAFASGQSYARGMDDGSLRARLNIAARGLGLIGLGLLRAVLNAPRHPAWQNWAVEELAWPCDGLGRLAELLRLPVAVGR